MISLITYFKSKGVLYSPFVRRPQIERSVKETFIHKSCFNTSRLIVDSLGTGQDYAQILKAFHISLLYFPIGSSKGAIYHGKTIIHEVEGEDKLRCSYEKPNYRRSI